MAFYEPSSEMKSTVRFANMVAAQQYYIDYGNDVIINRLLTLLPNYIPDYCLSVGDKAVERWAQLTVTALKKVNYFLKLFFYSFLPWG